MPSEITVETVISKTMRTARVSAFADPAQFSVAETPVPVPGRGELLVKVDTAAIVFGDTLINKGRYQIKPVLPFTPGAEGSGTIVACGPGTPGFQTGDRVAVCGFVGDARVTRLIVGMMCEYAIVPQENAILVPAGVSLEAAALFRSNAETAAFALRKGALAPGETLLVLGAGGGTGLAAVQFGKLFGARVIASASSPAKRQLALDAGADLAIDSRAADWRAQVNRLTDGRGLDMVYDPVGGEFSERAFRALRWNGRHLVIGFAAGAIPALPLNLPLMKGAHVIGCNLLQERKYEPAAYEALAAEVMGLLAQGKVSVPPVAARFPLDAIGKAYEEVAGGEVVGRVVVKPWD